MSTSPSARPAHLGWRLLALVYDFFPMLALSLAYGALLTGLAAVLGHPDLSDQPWLRPLTLLGLWATCGAYLWLSWSRGGATLGMRPWRLRVTAADGQPASHRGLWQRYAFATAPALLALEALPLLPLPDPRFALWMAAALAALGPLWSLWDRDGAALYDRLAGTALVRVDAPAS